MAAKKRSELQALITAWAATLDLEATHKPDELEILDSVLLNRDEIDTIAVAGAATDVDLDGYDTIIINTTQSTALTITNLVDSEVKYLVINKNAANAITFANATDISYDLTYNNGLTLLIYKVISKGSAGIFAIPQHKTFDFSALLTSASLLPGEWNVASLTSPWLAYTVPANSLQGAYYRTNGNYIDISINVYRTLGYSPTIFTLPAGYRPDYTYMVPVFCDGTYDNEIQVLPDGTVKHYSSFASPTNIWGLLQIPLLIS